MSPTQRQRTAQAARSANARGATTNRDTTAAGGHTPRGRRWVGAVVACVAVLGAVIVVALVNSDEPPASLSTELSALPVPDASGALGISAPATRYRVTYRLDSTDSEAAPVDLGASLELDTSTGAAPSTGADALDVVTSTESFSVQRPFRTLIESRAGAPPGGERQWAIVSDLGVSSSLASGASEPDVETILPSAGIGDWRLDAVLGDLVADGSFVVGERRSLLGRQCQVYRTGSPLEDYEVTPPAATTYADLCVDAAGLVLEQVAVRGGEVVEHLTATAVDVDPALTDDDFAIVGSPAPLTSGGMRLTLLGGATDDASYWSLPSPPVGYELIGRYTLEQNATDVTSSGVPVDTSGVGATTVVTSYVDVYTHGPDTVVIHQGPTSVERGGVPTTTATVAPLGEVQLDARLTGNDLVAHPASTPDWFVDVSATMPRAAVMELAGTLRNLGA